MDAKTNRLNKYGKKYIYFTKKNKFLNVLSFYTIKEFLNLYFAFKYQIFKGNLYLKNKREEKFGCCCCFFSSFYLKPFSLLLPPRRYITFGRPIYWWF